MVADADARLRPRRAANRHACSLLCRARRGTAGRRAAPSDEATARGLGRVAVYKCGQCHPADSEATAPQGVDPDDVAINLMLAQSRLRPSWVRGFLAHPKDTVGTQPRMPSVFYTPDGIAKVDRPDRDINDIVSYLFHMSEPLHVSLERIAEQRKAERKSEEIDWRVRK